MLNEASDQGGGSRPMPASSRSLQLAGREFRAVWLAEALSVAGDQLARVAVSVLVYQRTSSAALTALTYAMTFLPDLVAGPLMSGLADRYPRREVMVVCAVAQAMLISGLAALVAFHAPIALLAAIVALDAAASAPFRAAQTASARVILGDELMAPGQARLWTLREAGQLLGLVGAGGVVSLFGTTSALLLDAATYLAAAALLGLGLKQRPAARIRGVAAARLTLRPDPRRRALVSFSLLAALTILPFGLVVPLVDELGAPVWAVGLLLAADPLGLVLSGWLVGRARTTRDRQYRRITPLALLCLGAMVPFALAPSPVWAALLLAMSGLGAAYQIYAKAAYVELLPDAVTGHATGMVRTGLRAAQGFTVVLGGFAAEWLGSAATTIALGGLIGVIGCVLAGAALHRSTENDRPGPSTSVAGVSLGGHPAPRRRHGHM